MNLLEMKDADWYDTIDINVTGIAHTARAFARTLCDHKSGRTILKGVVRTTCDAGLSEPTFCSAPHS